MKQGYFIACLMLALLPRMANAQIVLYVAQHGKADHRSIQAAINALPAGNEPATIHIASGVYREKLYIERPGIHFVGADRESTIIMASIARDEWRCLVNDDWGVATMNVKANDIMLQNLTVVNNFGWEFQQPYMVNCPTDTTSVTKQITGRSHQMALRTMHCTRLKAINCHFKAKGGDTVSPWNVGEGMWYFKDCIMEGGVDFYCPRGWAWAENCQFIAHTGTAAIWHDGSADADAKTVFRGCRFSGYDGFILGRYHRDAQFYLIDCRFDDNMLDSAIYRVPTNNTIRWGHRVFYYNCNRQAGNYAWFANNITVDELQSVATPQQVFLHKWNPE